MNNTHLVEHKVLDHGHVKLVDHMGTDLSIVRAARVSYKAEWRPGEDDASDHKLINFLFRHQHSTPFEHCTVTIGVKAPIFVYRQWHRHRTQSYSEQSLRYQEAEDCFYIPDFNTIGVQSKTNKQSRDIIPQTGKDIINDRIWEVSEYEKACREAFEVYKYLLAKGWPRELARIVLPLSTYSSMFATANLLNWFKFLSLRTDGHAQYEIRVYGDAVLEIIKSLYPVATEAFLKYDARLNGKL